MKYQHVQPVFFEGKIWLVNKALLLENCAPVISVYPFDLDTRIIGDPILDQEPMCTRDNWEEKQMAKVSPKSKFFKQNGHLILFYCVHNDTTNGTRTFKLQQLDLLTGELSTYRSEELPAEDENDENRTWKSNDTDFVIWDLGNLNTENKMYMPIEVENTTYQEMDEWLENKIILLVNTECEGYD